MLTELRRYRRRTVGSEDLVRCVDHLLYDAVQSLGGRQAVVGGHRRDIGGVGRPQQALGDAGGHVVRRHLVARTVVADPPQDHQQIP